MLIVEELIFSNTSFGTSGDPQNLSVYHYQNFPFPKYFERKLKFLLYEKKQSYDSCRKVEDNFVLFFVNMKKIWKNDLCSRIVVLGNRFASDDN